MSGFSKNIATASTRYTRSLNLYANAHGFQLMGLGGARERAMVYGLGVKIGGCTKTFAEDFLDNLQCALARMKKK